jgi:DNA-directed RNA polymerase I subunit RPA49
MAENAQLSNAPSGAANAAESAILSSMPADAAADIASKAAAVQAQVQANKPIPQANLDATHPADVYPIDVLVPNGLATLRQLPGVKEWADTVSAGLPVATTSRYVSRRVEAVVKSGNTTHLQLLRFILLLLEFAKSSAGPGSKRLPPREELRRILSSASGNPASTSKQQQQNTSQSDAGTLPDPVIDAIRRKFAPQGSHLTKNDLTFLHTTICALSLHIPPQPSKDGGASSLGGNSPNELATDPADLRDDLRLESATILQYFRELGCRVDKPRESEFAKWNIKGGKAEAAARRIARLKVPVEFPKVSRGGRR